jgi:hypothetical protein
LQPALRKLPAFAARSLAQKHTTALLHEHDAHVGAKTVLVDGISHANGD